MDQAQGGFLLQAPHLTNIQMGGRGGGHLGTTWCQIEAIAYYDSHEIWASKESRPAALTSGEKMLELGRALAKEGEGECLRILEISTAHLR